MDFNMYAAAVYTNQLMPGQTSYERRLEPHEQLICRKQPHILESYHYVGKQRYVNEMRASGAQIFLDSGAFSASTLGIEISVEEYCRYIQRNEDIIRKDEGTLMASVLDSIGDAQGTYENQKAMEALGVRPMPAFHGGEDTRYLDYYVANYDYVLLGGLVGMSKVQLEIWLDRMWERHLIDGAGRPKCKVHGFAVTAENLMRRYPWHSVDSSSWVQAAAFGSVLTTQFGPLKISSTSPSRQDAGRHLDTLTSLEQAAARRYIDGLGFNAERLATSPFSRFAFNLCYYPLINKTINKEKAERGFPVRRRELF